MNTNCKAVRVLERLRARVGGELRESARGVPHLVVGGTGGMSACYFAKQHCVKVFDNYANGPQQRWTFKEWQQAAAFIETNGQVNPLSRRLATALKRGNSMTRFLALAAVAASLQGCGVYNDMSRAEVAWQTAHLIDVAQTIEISRNRCYYEKVDSTAMFIGTNPSTESVVAWGVGASLAHAYVGRWVDRSERLPGWSKALLRSVDFGFKAGTVVNNHAIGIRIGGANRADNCKGN